MEATLNLQDLMQWGAFICLIGTLWWRVKQRDKERDLITTWRTNTDRDIKEIRNRLDRHEERDSRIYDRLDAILTKMTDISERLVKIETRMNGES